MPNRKKYFTEEERIAAHKQKTREWNQRNKEKCRQAEREHYNRNKKHLTANNAPIERKEKHDNRFNPDVVKIKAADNVRYEPRWDERNNRPYLVEVRLNA